MITKCPLPNCDFEYEEQEKFWKHFAVEHLGKTDGLLRDSTGFYGPVPKCDYPGCNRRNCMTRVVVRNGEKKELCLKHQGLL